MQDSVVTQQQIDALERVLDKVFAQVGIDVEFTRHFLDRVNDERNRKQITVKELAMLFKKEFQRWGKEIAKLGPDQEAVMKDLDSDINIPFALKWNGSELELIAKTVMRKPNFRTTNKEFPVENIEDYAANFVKEMRTTLERELTGGEKRSKEAHFKKLKKHKGDFEKRYGNDAEGVMHGLATKRAKGESTETNPKHAVPDNRFTPGMNKGGEDGIAHNKTNKSLKRGIAESTYSVAVEFMDDLDWDLGNLPRMDWGAYEEKELEVIIDYLENLDFDDQSNDSYNGMFAKAAKYVEGILNKRGVTEGDNNMVPDHEVAMAKSDLYNLAKNSIRLYELMLDVSEAEGLEGWQQGKITQANDYITSVYQSLSHDMATEATQTELDADEVDEFHKDLDDLVHKHLGHSSDEIDEAAPKIDPDKWAEYQASKQKPKKVSSTQKSLASIRQKTEGGMKRIATTQSNKAERIGAGGKQGLETFKKKDTTEATDCWDGYAPGAQSGVKTKPGTGKNKGKRVNNCEPINKK